MSRNCRYVVNIGDKSYSLSSEKIRVLEEIERPLAVPICHSNGFFGSAASVESQLFFLLKSINIVKQRPVVYVLSCRSGLL